MSVHISWHSGMCSGAPKQEGRRPKKPVHWVGAVWLQLPSGEMDTRAFRSNKPMTCGNAQTVLDQLRQSLRGEHGKDAGVWSGFWIKSR